MPGHVEVAGHDGKRLVGATLATPQQGNGRVVARVAGDVIATESLDRHHLARAEGPLGGGDGGVGSVDPAVGRLEPQPRSARRTRQRLGVETPVTWVVVLGGAQVTEGETGHGGVGPVVRQPFGDGEAGAAVGTGDEGVAVPPVGGVEQLPEAVVAQGRIGRDERAHRGVGPALDDPEPRFAQDFGVRGLDRIDPGQRGRLTPEPGFEGADGGRGTFDFDEDAVGVVADVTGEGTLAGQPVHERPVADALDDAPDPDAHAHGCAARRRAGRACRRTRRSGHGCDPTGRARRRRSRLT